MNKDKALKILSLEEGFTDEELKKAYRRLAKEHHPDNYMLESDSVKLEHEEKMKEINAAFDYFIKFNLDNYRLEIINKMRGYYENTTVVGNLKLIFDVRNAAEQCEDLVYYRDTKEEIDSVFNRFLREIEAEYKAYEFLFFQGNFIDKSEVKEIINYNLKVEDFYKQLCSIRDKYSKKIKFQKRVEQEIAPYKLYATCTKHLWQLISIACVNNADVKAEKNGYCDFEEPIRLMHEEIKDLFKLVDEINEMFNTIEKELKIINSEELKQDYEKLKRCYDRGDAFSDIENGLKRLIQKIKEYKKEQERLAKMEKNEPVVNSLYNKLLCNYNSSLAVLNPVTDNDRIKEVTEFFQIVMNLFLKYSAGLIDIDCLLMLDEITFMDMIKDKELLNAIIEGKTADSNKIKIYLKRKPFCNQLLDDQCFFVLREENGKYFMRKMLTTESSEQEISEVRVGREYVSLDEVMKAAIYQGYYALFLNYNIVQNLYELNVDGDYRYIILYDGRIRIASDGTALSDTINVCGDEYKDKEYFMHTLQEQIQIDLDKSNSRK